MGDSKKSTEPIATLPFDVGSFKESLAPLVREMGLICDKLENAGPKLAAYNRVIHYVVEEMKNFPNEKKVILQALFDCTSGSLVERLKVYSDLLAGIICSENKDSNDGIEAVTGARRAIGQMRVKKGHLVH